MRTEAFKQTYLSRSFERAFKLVYIIISLFCLFVCVCLTSYRLGPWTSYTHETDIIRTSMTWRGAIRWNFFRKVTSNGITEEKSYSTNAFLWWKFWSFMFIYPISNFSTGIHMKVIRNEFSAIDTPPMLF
jgi:hypothetical protein